MTIAAELRLRQARIRYHLAAQGALDLVQVHRNLNDGPGRRRGPALTLNRSAIVLAVAAWQAYVEDVALAIVVGLAPQSGTRLAATYRLVKSHVEARVKLLSTPNSGKTKELLALVSFDPTSAWGVSFEWERQRSARHGSMRTSITLTPAAAIVELDRWMKLRHAIAHGNPLDARGAYAYLLTGLAQGRPVVNRRDADRCAAFLAALVEATTEEAIRAFA